MTRKEKKIRKKALRGSIEPTSGRWVSMRDIFNMAMELRKNGSRANRKNCSALANMLH